MKDFIEGEEWRDVVGYEGLYEVSNLGRVYSLPKRINSKCSHNGKFLKPISDGDGYYRVMLYKEKVRKTCKISRLVAITFLELVADKTIVDHIDGDRKNDKLNNLRWCTHRENMTNNHKKRNNHTKFTGVRAGCGRYYSQIWYNGKVKYLGVFDIQEEASEAYQNAKKKICDYENECIINGISHKNGVLADIL